MRLAVEAKGGVVFAEAAFGPREIGAKRGIPDVTEFVAEMTSRAPAQVAAHTE